MAVELPGFRFTLPAAADLSALQYTFVDVNSSGQAAAGANDGRAVGVLQNKPNAAGKSATIMKSGISKVVAGGTVTAGDDITMDTGGVAITAESTARRLGVALTTATGPALVSILLDSDGITP